MQILFYPVYPSKILLPVSKTENKNTKVLTSFSLKMGDNKIEISCNQSLEAQAENFDQGKILLLQD